MKKFFFLLVILGLTACSAQKPRTTAEMTLDEIEAAWVHASTPGEHHTYLKPLVGNWETTVKMWMSPALPPEESHGKAKHAWVLDGRFVLEEYQGKMDKTPFHGMGMMGYDNLAGKYVSIWGDTMGTGLLQTSGTYDAANKTFTLEGLFTDPITRIPRPTKSITRVISDKQFVYEMYDLDSTGREFKSLEVTYNRKS